LSTDYALHQDFKKAEVEFKIARNPDSANLLSDFFVANANSVKSPLNPDKNIIA
jgi:hypothetical protein